jgi:hypothetical protein
LINRWVSPELALPITDHRSPITNHYSPITNHVSVRFAAWQAALQVQPWNCN